MTTPSEEYCRFRHEMRDTNDPPLFCDDFIKFAYDEAERQAAKIGKLLFDRTSYVCNIPLLTGVNSYRLDETVFEVARVTVFDGTARWTAKARDLYEFDMLQPDWRSMNFSETKSIFVYDSTIEIAGNCDFDGTLNIECYRLPLQKASDADQFEISAQHHSYLIDWAKYLAYQTRDADTEQAEYARIHEERFRAYFSGVAAAAGAAKGKQRKPDVAARSGRGATPAQLTDAFFAECGDLNYKNTDGRQLDAGWARSLIEDYVNEAEYEACERLNIIFDSSSSICSISTNPATKSYLIDSKVVGIKSISFTDAALENYEINYREKHEFAKVNPLFKSLPFTENKSVFIDNYTLEIAGIPTSGTLHLEIYRTPLANASVSGQFEIPDKYHASLLDWAKYKAFSNPDTDIYDEAKAAVFLARFEGSFGKKRELWISESIKTSLPVLASAGTALTPSYLFNLFVHECGGYSFRNTDGFVYDAGWVRNLILGYIDEAEKEACERADLIYDTSTSAVCSISVNTSSATYLIDDSIYFIKAIKFTDSLGNSFDVLVRNKNEFLKINSSYRSEAFSVSKSVFIENRTIEIAGVTGVTGVIHLEVYRTPLANASVADQFEIPSRYSSSLINWVKFKAFSNPDIDIYDEAKAAAFLARFEDSFGKRQARGIVSDEIKKSLPAIQSRSQRAITPSAAINLFVHECGGISFKNSDGFLKDAGWAESVLIGYLDEAEYEACERSNILFDKDTPAVCQIPVIAGQSVYPLHGSVTGISYVKFAPAVGSQFDVLAREKVEFGQISPAWRAAGFSVNKSAFVHDSEIELAGVPDVAGTLHLEVYRTPLANASVADQFEIPEKHHAKLLDWVKYRAFSNPDIDIYDVKKSYVFYGQFQRAFGKRRDRGYIADEIKTALPVSVNTSGALTPIDLCNMFRLDARDKAFKNTDGTLHDAGWRTDLLLAYVDEAEREAAARADLIFDSTTEAVCKIAVTTGTKIYRIDSRINRIDNARFVASGDSFEIEIVYRSNEYDRSESWASDDFSSTRRLFVDDVNIELSGILSAGGDIILSVYRNPLVSAASSGLFEISERHQSKLLHWVAYRAYTSVDNDIYHDLGLYHLKEFERYFGYSKKQDAWRYSQRNEPLVTAYQGI